MGEQLRRIRSFSLRGARLGDKYEQLMAEHGRQYVIDIPCGEGVSTIDPDARVDIASEFGRSAPLVIEVGPGSGEQLVASALADPSRNYLGLEAWAPGVARCVKTALAARVSNVRIMQLDAAQGLPVLFKRPDETGENLLDGERETAGLLAGNPLADELWTFFPDPWRKRKHRKRRIVSPHFAYTVAGALREGGLWRLATDWSNYAWQMRDVLLESPWFDLCIAENSGDGAAADRSGSEGESGDGERGGVLLGEGECGGSEADLGVYEGGWAARWSGRIVTRFEERGIEAGRHVYDLLARRNSVPLDAFPIPEDPWVAAQARGQIVLADQPGVVPAASSRSGWLKEQREQGSTNQCSVKQSLLKQGSLQQDATHQEAQ